jgi:hypothetical protein
MKIALFSLRRLVMWYTAHGYSTRSGLPITDLYPKLIHKPRSDTSILEPEIDFLIILDKKYLITEKTQRKIPLKVLRQDEFL